MKVLIIGSGGREHALAWKISLSPEVEKVYVAPGNAGTASEPKVENIAVACEDFPALVRFAHDREIGLTLVGPEAPLVAGIVDAFEAEGLRCLGPNQAAASLEGSKVFAKAFMMRHGIPTAPYASFTQLEEALAYIRTQAVPLVIKADGLAAGKGVIVARTHAQAMQAARDMLAGGLFGEAGRTIVIERFLDGEEASVIVLTDGKQVLPLASAQDHKARDEGDTGPNTGGMGACSPAPVITTEVQARILGEVISPTVQAMSAEGRPYRGFLYAGLMIGPEGAPYVLEYNCRLGDPETQPILMRLRSDLIKICNACLEGTLDQVHAVWDRRAALGVVLASGGYPHHYRTGQVITGLEAPDLEAVKVFHAGTSIHQGRVVTSGGRVLCVTALGDTLTEAQQRAYNRVASISWEGMYYRRDIGSRAIAREGAQWPVSASNET